MKAYDQPQMNITVIAQDIVTLSLPVVRPSQKGEGGTFDNGVPNWD